MVKYKLHELENNSNVGIFVIIANELAEINKNLSQMRDLGRVKK